MSEPIIELMKLREQNSEHMLELAKKVFEPLKNIYISKHIEGMFWWTTEVKKPLNIYYKYTGLNAVRVQFAFPDIVSFYFTAKELNAILLNEISFDYDLTEKLDKIYMIGNRFLKPV